MLTYALLAVTASLVVTEILLIFTLRDAVREMRALRRDVPRMLGALAALVALVEAARAATLRKWRE